MRILLTVVGRSDSYSITSYTLGDKSFKHWYSSYALFNLLQEEDIFVDKVIVLYPDTPEGRQSYEVGFDDGVHIAIKDLFSEVEVEGYVLKDINSEEDASKVIEALYNLLIRELNMSIDSIDIIFDITHSFRHFTIIVLLFAEFLNKVSSAISSFSERGDVKYINIENIYYAKFMGARSHFMTLKPISILVSRVSDAYNIIQRLDYVAIDRLIGDIWSMLFPEGRVDKVKSQQWTKIKKFLNTAKYVLFMLSSGVVWHDTVFSKIDTLDFNQIPMDIDPTISIILEAVSIELSKISVHLNDEKIWRRQLKLAKLIRDRRGDLSMALSLATEGFLSWIIEEIEKKDPVDPNVRKAAGHVGTFRRYLQSYIAQNQCDSEVVAVYEILSKLLEKRNAFAHAFTDKDLLSKITVRNTNSILDDLEPLLDALSNQRLVISFSSIWQSYKQQINNELAK